MLLMEKHLERWIFGYLRQRLQRLPAPKPSHVLFALCDHFEPLWGGADPSVGLCRVNAWRERYPELGREFRDVDGRPPRHTFFFPAEQYSPDLMAPLAELTRQGLAEVELHLHHRDDDAPQLEHTIVEALTRYASHGLLSRDANGALRYAFVHGNWCLANSGPWCGVDSELDVLWRTGCFADFTFPSAPDPSQPPIVNEIYWPLGDPKRARGHERGEPARVGRRRRDRILLVEGPLGFDRGGRFGVRMENGALSERDPPTERRARTWLRQDVHVRGRPEWAFVKVHTHGAPESRARALLGTSGRELHRALAALGTRLHYVTAREMYCIACAAMDGHSGDPDLYRDYLLRPPPVVS